MSIKSRLLFAVTAALVLMCGCEKRSDFELPEIEAKHYSFDEIENISDEELIGLADYARHHYFSNPPLDYPQNLFVEDYFEPLDGEIVIRIKFIPEGADLDEYCREERHYPMYSEYYDDKVKDGTCKDRLVEHVEDNDVYSAWKGSYTEIRNTGTCYFHHNILFMKNFSEDGWRYTGEMTADEIARNFDVLTCDYNERKVCRRVVETENAFVYEYYFVHYIGGDWNLNGNIKLGGRALYISKEDGSFPCVEQTENDRFYCRHGEKITYSRRCEIPDSAL
ncbi:MAG: hypothetical protein K2H23_09075 [Oscillospiraceae bacterium]|nr:hypothetical protein [Oscillospiraceae bacterium]